MSLNIPDFAADPRNLSVASGLWSNPKTWSQGHVPIDGDIVVIMAGTSVTYDVNSNARIKTVSILGDLNFSVSVNTLMRVVNLVVQPSGSLEIGTVDNPIPANYTANIVIADQPTDPVLDPQQFGTGMIVLGKIRMCGAAKTPFGRLSVEPKAGDTTLTFAQPVSGWQVGDDIIVPDTRQLTDATKGAKYVSQIEKMQVLSVSGNVVTLNSPLLFSHKGAYDGSGTLQLYPHVMNVGRNVMISSENFVGTRGYTLFTGRADVDIRYSGWCEMGRTLNVGQTVRDRYAVTVLNLVGPATTPANGYQFTFIGNEIDNDGDGLPNNTNIQWGINLENSFYGLVQQNVVYSVAGVGIGVGDGIASFNTFDQNMSVNVVGTGGRLDGQQSGSAFWFGNPNNVVTNNVASSVNGAGQPYSYGFQVDVSNRDQKPVGKVSLPVSKGTDPSQPGQSVMVNMNATPLLNFSGNEVYGATSRGYIIWWLNTIFETPQGSSAGTMLNNTCWNQAWSAFFAYESAFFTIDGFTVYNLYTGQYGITSGVEFGDYMTRNAVVKNINIQGSMRCVCVPAFVGRNSPAGTFTLQDSTLNGVKDVYVPLAQNTNGGKGLDDRNITVQNVTFSHPANEQGEFDLYMDSVMNVSPSFYNLLSVTTLQVNAFNGVATDNFLAYFGPPNSNAPANAVPRNGVYGLVVAD